MDMIIRCLLLHILPSEIRGRTRRGRMSACSLFSSNLILSLNLFIDLTIRGSAFIRPKHQHNDKTHSTKGPEALFVKSITSEWGRIEWCSIVSTWSGSCFCQSVVLLLTVLSPRYKVMSNCSAMFTDFFLNTVFLKSKTRNQSYLRFI